MKNKKQNKIKKDKKYYFLQDWGTYQNQTLVCIGQTYEDVLRITKRMNSNKAFLEFVIESKDYIDKWANGKGMFVSSEGGYSILYMKKWEESWEWYEVLMHELFHAVTFMGKFRSMENEEEALAYQQEWLFRQMRRKLQKVKF